MSNTYYDILGLRASASQDEIKRAYRKKAMESHPDVNPSPGAADAFLKINEAYAILGDAQKRQIYNQKLRDQAAQSAGKSYAKGSQAARDEAYRQWVQQARAQAAANASMNFNDFKRSRFARGEASVFLYLQFLILGMFFVLGTLIIIGPVAAMFMVDWKAIFVSLAAVPLALRIYAEGWRGLKTLRASM